MLTYAVRVQNVEAVISLLSQGSDPNTPNVKEVTPLSGAAHKGNVEIMNILLAAGALTDNPNSQGSTPLIQVSIFVIICSMPFIFLK